MARLAVGFVLAAILAVAGWTTAAQSAARTPARVPMPAAAALVVSQQCARVQIRSAVRRFFTTWDRRERRPLGRLFGADGILDMATKHQDTRRDQAWSEAVGAGQIGAFAARQWRLGEVLSYHGMTLYTGPYAGTGAEVDEVSARFADGSVQPIEEAKFNYDCTARAFTHVVIISAGPARRP